MLLFTQFCMHKTTGEVWYPQRLVCWSKSRCFAIKTHRCGREPIEAGDSETKHTVLHAQNDRSCLVPIETNNSDARHAVLHAENHR